MTNENYDDDWSPYCPVCNSCGCEGCCPEWVCQHKEGCLYPETPNTLWIKLQRKIKLFRHHFWNDLPFTLKQIFICNIVGHKYLEDSGAFKSLCLRCFFHRKIK